MKEIGVRIRAARQERGLTIEDLYERTRIRQRIIEAIEEGSFDLIPGGPVYTKGFIRTLSEELELDFSQLMALWEPAASLVGPTVASEKQSRQSILPIIGVAVMVLALAGAGVYYVYLRPQPQLPPVTEQPDTTDPVDEEPEIPADPEPEAPAYTFLGEQNGVLVYEVPTWPLQLTVRVTRESCWISATPDDLPAQEATIYAGQERVLVANGLLKVKLGKARVTEFVINGEVISGQTGDVRDYIFKKSGP